MNPESDNDWLDEALTSRPVMTPPRTFTAAVMATLVPEPPPSRATDLLAEHGVGAGLALAAFGVWVVVDLNRPAAVLAAALEAPEAITVVTVLAVCLAWVLVRKEPESEAL